MKHSAVVTRVLLLLGDRDIIISAFNLTTIISFTQSTMIVINKHWIATLFVLHMVFLLSLHTLVVPHVSLRATESSERLLVDTNHPSLSLPKQESASPLSYGTADQPFAQTMAEFKFHLLKHGQAQDPHKSYAVQEVELIAKASRMALDMFSAWRLSGRTGLNHAIGTASCMLHLNSPSEYVILALMHNVYFAFWAEHAVGVSEHPFFHQGDICARRRWVAEQLGSDLEFKMWRYYSMWSGRPEKDEPKLWLYMFKKFPHLLEDMDKHIISFVMCDEVEQYHAFEQLWVDNDRRRTHEFQSEFLQAIDVLAADPTMAEQKFEMLRSHAEAVFKETNELFDEENAIEKSFEMQFRDMFEPVFRKVSYAPFVNWAHLSQVNLYVRLCRKNIPRCARNWVQHKSFWETTCCEQQGPCAIDKANLEINYDETWWLLPRLFPQGNRTMHPNDIQVQCHGGPNEECKGVEEHKVPMISVDTTS
jgi:hypothetical protein